MIGWRLASLGEVDLQERERDRAGLEDAAASDEASSMKTRRARPPAPADGAQRAGARSSQGPLERGMKAGRYEILARIGDGGMGVVYRARDPELDRDVALKLLHPHLDEAAADAQARLVREAQALARLSHPAVVGIHDVGTIDGRVFLAMELVEGVTLRQWLASAERSCRDVVRVFMQAGEGLAAAHAAGLVHRDFKPENVLVNQNGRARILDFGLARTAAEDWPTTGLSSPHAGQPALGPLTQAGSIMGTPDYMAPEQFLGRPTDARTDQFSFCVSLYEALLGQRPFAGDDVFALAGEVTRGNVRPLVNRRVPARLLGVLLRGLSVSRAARYPSMDALLAQLAGAAASGRRRRLAAAIAAASVSIAALVSWQAWLRPRDRGPPPWTLARHQQVTFAGDVASHSLSPDGKSVAFFSSCGRLQLAQIDSGDTRVLWDPNPGFALVRTAPSWSPDGSRLIAAWRARAAGATISVIVPSRGGPARPLPEHLRLPAWSPDGRQVAHARPGTECVVAVRSLESDALTSIPIRAGCGEIADVSWSAAGQRLLVVTDEGQHGSTIWSVDPAGGAQDRLLEEPGSILLARWNAQASAVYYLRDEDWHPQLFVLALDGRSAPQRVAALHGVDLDVSLSLSRDDQRIAYARTSMRSSLIAATRRDDGTVETRRLTSGTRLLRGLSLSPDGQSVAFATTNGQVSEVFTLAISGGTPERRTSLGGGVKATAWSPDGKRVALTAEHNGAHRVWTLDLTTGATREYEGTLASPGCRLTSCGNLSWAPWPDILYKAGSGRNYRLLDPESGAERPLLPDDSRGWIHNARRSPDGQWVAALFSGTDTRRGLWLISREDLSERRLSDAVRRPVAWSADGQSLYAWNGSVADASDTAVFTIARSSGHATRLVTLPFPASRTGEVVMAADTKRFILNVDESTSDAWIAESVR